MERIKLIKPADRSFAEKAQEHWDSVAKPLGSFGALEEMWDRIAAVQRTVTPDISRRAVVVMCGDNGVTAEGVTQTAIHLVCLAEGYKRILLQSLLKQQMSHLAMDNHEQRVGTGVVGSHAEALERLRGVTLVGQRQRLLVVAFCLIGRTPAKQEKGQEEGQGGGSVVSHSSSRKNKGL